MRLYQSFTQEVKTPFPAKGGKIRYKRDCIKRRREINLHRELEQAINFGGIERSLATTQKILLARYSDDEKADLLSILNDDEYEFESRQRCKCPFKYESQWIDVWEYELED